MTTFQEDHKMRWYAVRVCFHNQCNFRIKTVPKGTCWEKNVNVQIESDKHTELKGLFIVFSSKLAVIPLCEHLRILLAGCLCIQTHHIMPQTHGFMMCWDQSSCWFSPREDSFAVSDPVSDPALHVSVHPLTTFLSFQLQARTASRGGSACKCSSWVHVDKMRTHNLDQSRRKPSSFSISGS